MTSQATLKAPRALLIKDWLAIARPPFHLVGIFPILLGTMLAIRRGAILRIDRLAAGLAVVVSVMLATYLLGEYFDFEGDALSARLERNRFSGGTQVLQAGRLNPRATVVVAVIALLIGVMAGTYAVAVTRNLWLLLIGLFCGGAGVFYSTPPVRWVQRGIGEILIALCYGLMPVIVGFALQTGFFSWQAGATSLPVSLTIFNVILINEIPDEPADRRTNKRNLVVRFGRLWAARFYAITAISTGLAILSLTALFSLRKTSDWILAIGLSTLAIGLAAAMLRGSWLDRKTLERLCGLTIVMNLASTIGLMVLCAKI